MDDISPTFRLFAECSAGTSAACTLGLLGMWGRACGGGVVTVLLEGQLRYSGDV